jgi:hypothetical protein
MATTIKVKTVKVPNLDTMSADEVDAVETDIKNVIKNKTDDGYDIAGIAGGNNFVIIVFQKTD